MPTKSWCWTRAGRRAGDHEILLAQGGAYASLWRRQQQEQEEAASPGIKKETPFNAPDDENWRERDDAILRATEI